MIFAGSGTRSSSGNGSTSALKGLSRGGKRGCQNVREGCLKKKGGNLLPKTGEFQRTVAKVTVDNGIVLEMWF